MVGEARWESGCLDELLVVFVNKSRFLYRQFILVASWAVNYPPACHRDGTHTPQAVEYALHLWTIPSGLATPVTHEIDAWQKIEMSRW